MRYEEPPYFLLGLGILLMIWGYLTYTHVLGGSVWIGFGGAVLVIVSLGIFSARGRTSRAVLGILQNHEGEKVKLSSLADELDMSEKELRAAIIDLRVDGKVKVQFDKNTGEVMIGEPKTRGRAEAATTKLVYCSYCGYPLPAGARFCPSCGSSID
jgi:biotin operon repressor